MSPHNDQPPADPAKRRPSDEELSRQWQRMAGVGFEFVGAILLFGAVGWGLDHWLGWEPWGLIVGLLFGCVVGMWLLIRIGLRSFK